MADDLETAQNDADESMSSAPADCGVAQCGGSSAGSSSGFDEPEDAPAKKKKTTWIAIKLVDTEGRPVAGEEYRITLPNGSTHEDDLDGHGFARINGIDPGSCQITFPNLDRESWKPK